MLTNVIKWSLRFPYFIRLFITCWLFEGYDFFEKKLFQKNWVYLLGCIDIEKLREINL